MVCRLDVALAQFLTVLDIVLACRLAYEGRWAMALAALACGAIAAILFYKRDMYDYISTHSVFHVVAGLGSAFAVM